MNQRPRTRRSQQHTLSPQVILTLAAVTYLALHPHIITLILTGIAAAAGILVAAAITYVIGLKLGWFGTPARITREGHRGRWSIEFL